MAGVKGRSGGARPGAGRKRKAPAAVAVELEPQPHGGALKRSKAPVPDATSPLHDGATRDPLTFLELVVNDPGAPLKDRIRAAVAAAQYRHTKKGDGGKKEEAADKAKKAAGGRFAPKAPPRLVVNNGG